MPVQYSGIIAEHQAVRSGVGLFDVSHMGEIRFTGPKAMAALNRRTLNFAMIETRAALDSIDAICGTEGIDGIFVGPNDLSVSLSEGAGAVDAGSPQVLSALDTIVAKARSHGIFTGIYAGSAAHAKAYLAKGFQLFALGSDIGLLESAGEAMLAEAKA